MNVKKALEKAKKVHFVGIGGISMSALALILKSNGYIVTGSDSTESEITHKLEQNGIKVFIGHSENNLTDCDMVVNTAAVHKDNCELKEAQRRGLPVFERTFLLGAVIDNYECPIAVAGTHGKTTTSSLISQIMLSANKNPTISVGGVIKSIDSNLYIGGNNYFVFESCEYVNSFLNFYPKISLILNIDADHLDFFKDIDDIICSFAKYIDNTKKGGVVIIPAEDSNVAKAVCDKNANIITFGIDKGNFLAKNIKYTNGYPEFDVYEQNKYFCHLKLAIPGEHNVKNALGAVIACKLCGCSAKEIECGAGEFTGSHRRFEKIGEKNGVVVIDDYAHHPTEIQTTINTARKMNFNNVYYVFQPHTYTRTKLLKNEFINVLSECDKLVLAQIYPAREQDIYNISSNDLCEQISQSVCPGDFDKIVEYLKENVKSGDAIITVGAGDVYKIGKKFLNQN